jgi:hypothetical protein
MVTNIFSEPTREEKVQDYAEYCKTKLQEFVSKIIRELAGADDGGEQ